MKTLACIVVLMLVELLALCAPGEAQATSPTLKTIYSFSTADVSAGEAPVGNPAIGTGGVLYGATSGGGTSGCGTAFSLTPPASAGNAWTYALLHTFTGAPTDGCVPQGGVVIGSSGVLYGTTGAGGANNGGAVYSLTPPASPGGSWTFALPYGGFSSETVAHPGWSLAIGSGGVLYGVAEGIFGGTDDTFASGVFSVTPPASPGGAWTFAVLYSFPDSGPYPQGGVVIGAGVLYGTAESDTGGFGAVYSLTPPGSPGGAWVETTLYSFVGPPADGAGPYGSVALGPGGVLYGITVGGGSGPCDVVFPGCGAVFSLTPPASPGGTWTEAVLYDFAGAPDDGEVPLGGVALAKNGVLYGTTQYGGNSPHHCYPRGSEDYPGCGTVFSLTPPASPGGAWAEAVLFNFNGNPGAVPEAAPTIEGAKLYGTTDGTTTYGNSGNEGTVFVLKP